MFVHVVLTEDLREDWTCPTEPPLKIKSLLLLLLKWTHPNDKDGNVHSSHKGKSCLSGIDS